MVNIKISAREFDILKNMGGVLLEDEISYEDENGEDSTIEIMLNRGIIKEKIENESK